MPRITVLETVAWFISKLTVFPTEPDAWCCQSSQPDAWCCQSSRRNLMLDVANLPNWIWYLMSPIFPAEPDAWCCQSSQHNLMFDVVNLPNINLMLDVANLPNITSCLTLSIFPTSTWCLTLPIIPTEPDARCCQSSQLNLMLDVANQLVYWKTTRILKHKMGN